MYENDVCGNLRSICTSQVHTVYTVYFIYYQCVPGIQQNNIIYNFLISSVIQPQHKLNVTRYLHVTTEHDAITHTQDNIISKVCLPHSLS